MTMRHILMTVTSFLALGAAACDGDSVGGGGDEAGTQCELSFSVSNAAGKDFGQECASDAECKFGECMKPGDKGNITNTKFGFCTRGCDCENSDAARIPDDQKEGGLECVYPSDGAGGLIDFHFVAVECVDVAKCQALASGWNDCRIPSTGSARSVCHAD